MLIVNADDFGLRPAATDAILDVYRAGRITSATAMVHMEDSARAASLAREYGLPLGLHLNLTFPYADSKAPHTARERQSRLVRYFSRPTARIAYDPRIRRLVSDCVQDQLESFASDYASIPTHVDGHEHIHVCPTVALCPALSSVTRVRLAHTYVRGERPALNRLIRAAQNALLRRRFHTTAGFLPLGDVHPDLGGDGLERLALAARASLEVMTHPPRPAERRALLAPAWGNALAEYRTGTYAEL